MLLGAFQVRLGNSIWTLILISRSYKSEKKSRGFFFLYFFFSLRSFKSNVKQ